MESNIITTPGGKFVNFIPSRVVAVTASDTTMLQEGTLYVGTGGDVKCLPSGNAADGWITFSGVPDGTFIPIYVKAVHTDTTASNILICY